jgi:hypothetical protein
MKPAPLLLAALALLALLFLTACRDSDTDVLADACTELNELQQSVTAFEALGPTSTIEQVQEAADDLREQAHEAALAVRRVKEAHYQELADAQSDLAEAVRNVDDDDTVAQALAQLQPYRQQVAAAREQLTSSLNCR